MHNITIYYRATCSVLDKNTDFEEDTHITKVVSSKPAHDEVYSIQHYVIKFVSDLRQVGGFHRVLRFPS